MIPQNISQVQEGGLSTTGEHMNKEQHSSKSITAAPAPLFSTQSVRETSTTASSSHNITGMVVFVFVKLAMCWLLYSITFGKGFRLEDRLSKFSYVLLCSHSALCNYLQ
jgi:hypothetical protein